MLIVTHFVGFVFPSVLLGMRDCAHLGEDTEGLSGLLGKDGPIS